MTNPEDWFIPPVVMQYLDIRVDGQSDWRSWWDRGADNGLKQFVGDYVEDELIPPLNADIRAASKPCRVEITVEASILPEASSDLDDPPVAEWEISLAGTTQFVGEGVELVRLVRDAAIRDRVHAAIEFKPITVLPRGEPDHELLASVRGQSSQEQAQQWRAQYRQSRRVSYRHRMYGSPVAIYADVYFRLGGVEHLIAVCHVMIDKDEEDRSGAEIIGGEPEGFDAWLRAGKVDVILRPNPALAERTVDVTEIWGEDIVIEDVPVVLQDANDVDG